MTKRYPYLHEKMTNPDRYNEQDLFIIIYSRIIESFFSIL